MTSCGARSHVRLLALLSVAVGLLGSVNGQSADPNDFSDGPLDIQITGPNGSFEFNTVSDEQPRCLAHEMTSAGQGVYVSGSGVYVSGSAGGLVLGTSVSVVEPGKVTVEAADEAAQALDRASTFSASQTFGQLLALGAAARNSVVLIVVDDFAEKGPELPQDLWYLSAEAGHLDDLRMLVESGELSHGAMVLAHLMRLIHGSGRFTPTNDTHRFKIDGGPAELTVVPVDLAIGNPFGEGEPISSSHIATVLEASIRRWADTPVTASGRLGIVVNMSWVLLPCPTVVDFMAVDGPDWSFDEYVRSLEISVNGVLTDPEDDFGLRLGLLGRVSQHDHLRALLSGLDAASGLGTWLSDNSVDVAFVAAAGNFGMDYQLLPAALPTVIGVGTPIADRPLPLFSNAADVAAPGAWFHLDGVVSYAGTSYAAPMVSLFAALDLAGQHSCMPGAQNVGRPGLGLTKSGVQDPQTRALLGDAARECGYIGP